MAPLPPPQPSAPLRPPRRRERDAASANDVLGTDHGREDGPDVEAKKWRPPRDGILRGPPLSQPLPDESLGVELLEAMKQHGARPALVDAVTGHAATYDALVRDSMHLAHSLRQLLPRRAGAEAGDDAVVGVFAENRREVVPVVVASLLNSMPVCLLSPMSNTGELVRAWNASLPRVAFCSRGTLDVVLEASRSLPTLSVIVVFPSDTADAAGDEGGTVPAPASPRVQPYVELLSGRSEELAELAPASLPKGGGAAERTAFLLQCGPGGRIARLTHRNLVYTVRLLREPDAAGYGWVADDVLLLGAPLSHAFGLGVCLGALGLGLRVVVLSFFREQLFLSAAQAHRVSQLVLVPRQAALLAHSPLLEDAALVEGLALRQGLEPGLRRGLRGLRGVVCAAAPLARAPHRDLTRRLAAPCRQAYGLTQASCSLLVAPRGSPPDTQGRVVPGAEAKVAGADGAALGALQVGELLLRAPSVMAGYLDQDGADADVDADGWLRTGDLAYYDRNGFVFVVDRLKDVAFYSRARLKEHDEE